MSANTAELAGNYAMSGGAGDPEFVAEHLAEMNEERHERERDALEQTTAQAEVLHGDDPETIEVEVAGETVTFDPLGLGRRARLMRRAQRADERGDEAEALDVVLDMIDCLDDLSDSDHDQIWWDDRTESQVRGAFQTVARRSAGGNA